MYTPQIKGYLHPTVEYEKIVSALLKRSVSSATTVTTALRGAGSIEIIILMPNTKSEIQKAWSHKALIDSRHNMELIHDNFVFLA